MSSRSRHILRYLFLSILLVGLLAVSIPAAVAAEEVVTFPDSGLEAAVREAIGKPTGNIYQSDLDGLAYLDAYDRGITSLVGIEHCTSLTGLTLWINQVSDISPLSGLTSLEYLDLEDNQVSDISPLAGLTSLTTLWLSWNEVDDITELSSLTSLQYLFLSQNQISDISPLSGLTGLAGLDLGYNQIGDVSPLAGLTGLGWLSLNSNQVSNVTPLSSLTSLSDLDLGVNEVGGISALAPLTGLTRLVLYDNQVGNITPLSGLTGLADLQLGGNSVSDISPLAGLTSLEYLDLDNNQIGGITPLSGLTGLTGLDLGANQIMDISPVAGLTSLTWLTLGTNQISDISPLAGLTGLTDLSLEDNEIGDISPLAGLTGLEYLFLRDNQIADITPLSGLTSLTNLNLMDNRISDISSLGGLTSLTSLTLWMNQVSDVSPLAGLTSLEYLDLEDNQISDISALAGLTGLHTLWLAWNQVQDIQPLVDNPGIASDDFVSLYANPLSSTSIDTCIPALEARGVSVYWGSPNAYPDQPVNVSPADGATGVSLTPLLEASAFSDVDLGDMHTASQWQLTTTSGDYSSALFDSGEDYSNLESIEVPAGLLSPETEYFWRVSYADAYGGWSERSVETSFTTKEATPPPTPVLAYPADAKLTTDSTPWLDWSDVADPSGVQYSLQVDDDPAFASPTVSKTGLTASSRTLTALADGTYYWRVMAVDGAGNSSDWTSAWSFTIDATAPSVPVLSSQANGKITKDNTPWLDWSDVADATGVKYQIQVDDNADFSSPVLSKSGMTASSRTLSTLADGTYYWRVRAVDGAGNASAWTAAWSFTVDTVVPAVPTLAYPANGITTTDTTPWLDWSDVTDATGVTYRLQVDNNADFSSPVVNKTGLTSSSRTLSTLAPGTYFWRVRVTDGATNTSAWTAAWSFTVL